MTDSPMADMRLPFKDTLAFDRNLQDYIPFRTPTDAMLASLMLAYRLASPILTVVLALVRHPSFNPAEITLSRAEDVWTRVAEHEASTTATKTTRDECFPFAFPRVVLDEVIDLLEEERKMKLHIQRDVDDSYLGRLVLGKIDGDLRSLSLVCKEWTRPAQRALGRFLALQDVREEHLLNALNGPLFGHWTREILVLRHNLELDKEAQTSLVERGDELWVLVARLFSRVPNVHTVSICTDWFEWPLQYVTEGFERMPSLRELRLVQLGDITQLLGAVCKKVKHIPSLAHLYLRYSGSGSAYTNFVPPSELEDSPGPAFQKLSLNIGRASDLSLSYLSWLTRPRDGENGFKLKSLSLDLACCYYNERSCFDALEPCFCSLEELWVNVSGLGEGLLARIIESCRELRRLTLVFRHTFDNSTFEYLPCTLEDFCVDFSYEEPDWDAWDLRTYCFITSRACPLRCFAVRPLCYGAVVEMDDKFPKSRMMCKELGIDADFSCGTWNNSRWLQ